MSSDGGESEGPASEDAAPPVQPREISDVRTLRALAHPVRLALIEVLTIEGPMTATEAGERIGESPTTCSFHLRQLAKSNFVEEAGGGKGRARPWRLTSIHLQFSGHDDPELEIASNALIRLFRDRQLDRYRTWLETRAMFPPPWRRAAGETDLLFYVTADELKALNDELLAFLLPRFQDRLTDPSRRPDGSVPVEMLVFSYPVTLPKQNP
jgi:DNA-binding transcriptional ArsR family regulator